MYYKEFGGRHGGAEIKIGEVESAKKGILGHSSMKKAVDAHHGGGIGGNRVVYEYSITTRSSPCPSCDLVVRPFLTRDGVVARGGFRAGGNRGNGLGSLDKFDEFSVICKCPKPAVKAGKAGARGDGAAGRIKVEGGGCWCGGGGGGGGERVCRWWNGNGTRRSGHGCGGYTRKSWRWGGGSGGRDDPVGHLGDGGKIIGTVVIGIKKGVVPAGGEFG